MTLTGWAPETGAPRGGTSRVEEAVLDALDVAALHRTLADLVRVPSVTGSDAESELLAGLAERTARAGMDVDHWRLDVDALAARPGFPGTEVPRREAWGLVASTGTGDGPTVVLQGHVDVVPPGDPRRWGGDPWTPRPAGPRLYGRGACDMKAGVAADLAVAEAVLASGVRLPGRLALHLVGGEEDGGLGAFATLARGHRGDACVITEPTSGTLTTAAGGALTFRLVVPGEPAHGSTRWAGHSAVEHFGYLDAVLRELEAERNAVVDPLMAEYPVAHTLSIGTVVAGDWASTVPDSLTATGRLGVRLDEDPADARAAVEERLAAACAGHPFLRAHPVEVTWSGGQFAPGRTPAGAPLRDVVASAQADLTGTAPRERGVPYGSDLRLYAAEGVPTLHYGPGDVVHAHSYDEHVDLTELTAVTRVLALATVRLLAGRP
ncbi:ArgE/DapE family deacylase [Geodermatophilus sp. FMUSA9-8]|uniref:ArgE/DapE family deacylase n=1 Tax=Geodermatophilus sp. FMUSA9-8 TaxID=3120155 RepID=UPI00300B1038